jgi:hypothetical protein
MGMYLVSRAKREQLPPSNAPHTESNPECVLAQLGMDKWRNKKTHDKEVA